MTRFREYRGGLAESLETVREIGSRTELIGYLRRELEPFGIPVDDVDIEYCIWDSRIGWDTYTVRVKGYGVVGYCDGLLL
jgi:hypothetical protein